MRRPLSSQPSDEGWNEFSSELKPLGELLKLLSDFRSIASKAMVTLLTLIGSTACTTFDGIAGSFPPDTQLAISPNGQRLVVTWNDGPKKLYAKLIELDGARVKSVRDIPLPSATWFTTFASDEGHLLLTTLSKGASDLFKFDLATNRQELIYRSERNIRFPLEISLGSYAFLEEVPYNSRLGQWKRLQNSQVHLLNARTYSHTTRLNLTKGALYVLEGARPPAFPPLLGTPPEEIVKAVDDSTFSLHCADAAPLACLETSLRSKSDGQYFAVARILNGDSKCHIEGGWLDMREDQISRNGSTVVFHAALVRHDGARALYLIKNENASCVVNKISIERR
jgi:hypothetical protein